MPILRKEAKDDILSAHEWYERQRAGLGRAFVLEVGRTLDAVVENPAAYAQCYRSVRRALCRRFPYAIYFISRNSEVVVLAVLHQRRHPASWLRRSS